MPSEDPNRPEPALQSLEARFPQSPHSPGHARATLRAQLAAWRVPSDRSATAELLLSELVTNVVRHAGTWPPQQIGTRFALTDGLLRLEVSDACPAAPQLRAVGPDSESGRGMHLLAALADNWGVTRRPEGTGKTVWAEIKIPPTVPGVPAEGPTPSWL